MNVDIAEEVEVEVGMGMGIGMEANKRARFLYKLANCVSAY